MTLDLIALKRYEHYLNEKASDLEIRHFQLLSLEDQALIAKAWAEGQDARADHSASKREGDWV